MKKAISVVLCIALIVSLASVSAFAESEEKNLIVFVTGIGQSYTYSFDEKYLEEGSFENGNLHDYKNYTSLIENGQYQERWNLVYNIEDAIKTNPVFVADLGVFAGMVISSCIFGKRLYGGAIRNAVSAWLEYNTVDENGKLPENIITPQHPYPLSEYPYHINEDGEKESEAKSRFYSSIPCAEAAKEKLGEDYEDYLYCFNYSSFSYTSDNVKSLHSFIETILENNKVGADRVVLVPMSMGASVVSAYLSEYPEVSDNHVSRVVSIVGCWNGSDLVTDLLNLDYADDSADKFYSTLLPGYLNNMLGAPYGELIVLLLRLLPKAELRYVIDEVLDSIDRLILSTPSLLALIPSYDYMSIRDRIPEGNVRTEADRYYDCQITLRERMQALEKQGVTFSFISAYGSPFGAITEDYNIFGFLASSESTNSDEIINISSTAPGTGYVPYNEKFSDESGRILSPDRTIDISTTWYKNSTWFFYKEMHDLKYDNTALRLAVDLASGRIKTVSDCDNAAEDEFFYPQFNKARNIKQLNSDIKKLNSEVSLSELNEEQKAILKKAEEMKFRTENAPESDSKISADLHNMLIEMNLIKPEEESLNEAFVSAVSFVGRAVNLLFGSMGYFDR